MGLVERRVHGLKREASDRFMYHERRLPAIPILFVWDVRRRSIEDSVKAVQVALGDDCPSSASGGVVEAVPANAGDDKGEWDFGEVLAGLSSACEQCREVLANICDLVRRAALPAHDKGLDVLSLTK